MTRVLLVLAAVAAVATSVAGAQTFPNRIELPDGFQPEGIAIAGDQFYVGSIPTGKVYRGNLRTGQGAELVTAPAGPAAIGMKVDRGRLFVAGGGTGDAFVYDAKTGADHRVVRAPDERRHLRQRRRRHETGGLVHRLVPSCAVSAAARPERPSRPGLVDHTVTLAGDYVQGMGFNVNGIDATPNGKTLVFVQSGTGKLFTTGANGVARAIALAAPGGGAESVPNGDGILLDGKTLYVVQNQLNTVAKIRLSSNLRSGTVVTRVTNAQLPTTAQFSVPTTVAEHGSRLYAVNARFGTPPAGADYWITQFSK